MTTGPSVRRPLAGIRVLDSTDECGELCARLFADLGADVIKCEPPGGVVSRTLPPFGPGGESLSFGVRNTNKRSVVVDLTSKEGRESLDTLLAQADVWVESFRPSQLETLGIDLDAIRLAHSRLIVVSITDFGLRGPYRDYVATNDVMVATGGLLCRSGDIARPPLLPPGSLSYDVSATSAAFGALAALWQRFGTGQGQLIDVSVMQATSQIADWSMVNYIQTKEAGGVYDEIRKGSGLVYALYPCRDGFVRLVILSPRQWQAMRTWLGDPDFLDDDYWNSLPARMSIQEDLLIPTYVEFFKDKSASELAEEGQRRGIVITPVLSPREVLDQAHFIERGSFVSGEVAPGVEGPIASGFYEIDGQRAGYLRRSPAPGEHDEEVRQERSTGLAPEDQSQTHAAVAFPFTGLHVLDFGHGGVGVEAGRMFAEYGADVIKVETRTYPDFIRTLTGGLMSPSFASSNRCKRSLGVNAKHPDGLKVLYEMLSWADVMIENTSTGTMEDLGLSYETVRKINADLVVVSSQLMGSRGAWKSWLGYGPSTRSAGGMTYLWNFPDGGVPPGSTSIHPDHFAGRAAAVGALAMLVGRERLGSGGGHIEVAQVETIVNLLGDLLLEEGLEPGSVQPTGNRRSRGAPWGVYQCMGNERWCVITVRNDDDWQRFRTALGDPEWTRNPEFDHAAGRLAAADVIDGHVASWTAARTDHDVMTTLQACGVPSGFMAYPSDLVEDPHSVARKFPRPVVQPELGQLLLEGAAFEASGMPDPVAAPAPGLCQHTRQICRQVLGMKDERIDALILSGALEE